MLTPNAFAIPLTKSPATLLSLQKRALLWHLFCLYPRWIFPFGVLGKNLLLSTRKSRAMLLTAAILTEKIVFSKCRLWFEWIPRRQWQRLLINREASSSSTSVADNNSVENWNTSDSPGWERSPARIFGGRRWFQARCMAATARNKLRSETFWKNIEGALF